MSHNDTNFAWNCIRTTYHSNLSFKYIMSLNDTSFMKSQENQWDHLSLITIQSYANFTHSPTCHWLVKQLYQDRPQNFDIKIRSLWPAVEPSNKTIVSSIYTISGMGSKFCVFTREKQVSKSIQWETIKDIYFGVKYSHFLIYVNN